MRKAFVIEGDEETIKEIRLFIVSKLTAKNEPKGLKVVDTEPTFVCGCEDILDKDDYCE